MDLVALVRPPSFDKPAFDLDAVGATQVTQLPAVVIEPDKLRVQTGHGLAVDPDVAVRAAADGHAIALDQRGAALAVRHHDRQVHALHAHRAQCTAHPSGTAPATHQRREIAP